MEYLKSLFGTDNNKSGLSFDSKPTLPAVIPQSSKQEFVPAGVSNSKQHTFTDTVSERFNEVGSSLRSYITRFVPLEEDDCLSCKLIGVSVLWGAAGFVLIQGRKGSHRYTGFRKTAFYIQVALLSSGVFVLGVARLLDKSIFEKDARDKNVIDMVASDLSYLQKILQRFKTSGTDITRRPGD